MTDCSGDNRPVDSCTAFPRSSPPQTFAVTGATGYLGSRLTRRLHELGHRVIALKRTGSNVARIADILPVIACYDIDRQPLDVIFQEQRCTCVLHCATDYGRKTVSRASIIEANLVLPLRLLEAAIQHGTPFFVNTDTVLDKRVSDYSLSKRQFRDWLTALSTSIQGINVAIEHFYGPGDDTTKFVGEMVRRLLARETPIALTPGEQLRDFVYIDDVVDAFSHILEHHVTMETPTAVKDSFADSLLSYEIGSGLPVSIRHFMTTLRQIAGREDVALEFGAIPYRTNEVMHSQAQISPLLALGWSPRVSLAEGLRRTVTSEQLRMGSEHSCAT